MDASNMLKPMLARGELHCIGATTLDEYRKHIEKDAALERRFQPVFVGEPIGRGHHLHPARPARALRAAPQGAHQGRRAGGGGGAVASLHQPTASCPTRRSTWSTRRRRSCGWRRPACRPSWTRSAGGSCSSRSSARGCARRRTRPRGSGWSGSSRSWPTSRSRPAELEARWQRELEQLNRVGQLQERARRRPDRAGAGHAAGRLGARRAAASTRSRQLEQQLAEAEQDAARAQPRRPRAGQGGGRRAGHRRGRQQVDRRPGQQAAARARSRS